MCCFAQSQMQCQYIGFRVKLCSTQLGDVEGTVNKVAENRIELSQAIMNGKGLPIPSLVVESQFIQNIRILSTGGGDSSDDVSPKKDDPGSSGRAQRREMLRNMPNACNAYVCPSSPPLIHRSTGIPVQQPHHNGSPGRCVTSNVKQSDSAFSRVTIDDKVDRKQPKHKQSMTPMKRRSRSFSEVVPSNSDISGAESDSFYRSHPHNMRGLHPTATRHGLNRPHGRCGGGGGSIGINRGPGGPPSLSQLEEGPDGVGLPLIGNTRHSERSESSRAVYYSDATLTTNTPTLSSSRQRHEHHVPYYHPSLQSSTGEIRDVGCATNVSSYSHVACTTRLSQSHPRFWYSSTGFRVPILSTEDQDRMLHYLATGRDSHCLTESTATHELPALAQGLSWGRLLETAGRSLVDQIMTHVRQTTQTPQRSSHRPPPRVLVLSGGSHLSGALCITLARILSMRGACVLAFVPKCSLTDTPTKNTGVTGGTSAICRTELNLTLQFAPRPSHYGLEDEDEDEGGKSLDDYEEEEEVEDNAVSGAFDSSSAVNTNAKADSDRASCFTLDQLVQHGQITDPLDYSPVHRMWISRMPGFKLLHRPSSVLKIPTNVRIDLVIVGHGPSDAIEMNSHLSHWLQQHQALSYMVHVMPRTNVFKEPAYCNASSHWIVELGLPVLLPSQLVDPSSESASNNSTSGSRTISHLLVDVGLSRNLVRRLTSDLKSLPPYGLFDTGSVVTLCADLSSSVPPSS
ncbi:unnamed protein product [Echinostoma caproni]|uniref:YjeF N-terminal domain-containing protein n=1 Tax=Echinostoma caproni TaxID=27848 RepID=A0A183A6D0_9TREM|nr:unnamed protein product [Echinostoma caproni]